MKQISDVMKKNDVMEYRIDVKVPKYRRRKIELVTSLNFQQFQKYTTDFYGKILRGNYYISVQ